MKTLQHSKSRYLDQMNFQFINGKENHDFQKRTTMIMKTIYQKTSCQIQKLQVFIKVDHIVLRGNCQTYYLKQLAQEAVLNLDRQKEIFNEILVK